jgi:uncharacterized SAM-binding protein YcdF (DUF218 family)
MSRALSVLAGLVGAGLLALAAGFAWFVAQADRPADAPAHADGLVVLTGGADRVDTGLRLLAAGRADRLLVSGVAVKSDLASLARLSGLDPAPLAERVELGHAASTTHGNADETATWVHRHDIHTLIVVTGYYHMPRAMTELTRAVPEVTLYRLPVVPSLLRETGPAEGRLTGLRLLAEEFAKYLAVRAGLTRLQPADPGQRLAQEGRQSGGTHP